MGGLPSPTQRDNLDHGTCDFERPIPTSRDCFCFFFWGTLLGLWRSQKTISLGSWDSPKTMNLDFMALKRKDHEILVGIQFINSFRVDYLALTYFWNFFCLTLRGTTSPALTSILVLQAAWPSWVDVFSLTSRKGKIPMPGSSTLFSTSHMLHVRNI